MLKLEHIILNIYRTDKFIVKQDIYIQEDQFGRRLFSRDCYFYRNKKRDKDFVLLNKRNEFIDGYRIPTTTYIRKYVK